MESAVSNEREQLVLDEVHRGQPSASAFRDWHDWLG
jgi:hypothetical protein